MLIQTAPELANADWGQQVLRGKPAVKGGQAAPVGTVPEGRLETWALYAIGVHRLRQGAAAAVLKGWQYSLSGDLNGTVITRYLDSAAPLERTSSVLSRSQQDAYRKLVALPRVVEAGRAFEIAALRVHALHLNVMWLRAVSGGDDVVIPYGSYIKDLPEGQQFSFATYLQVARREAAKLTLTPDY